MSTFLNNMPLTTEQFKAAVAEKIENLTSLINGNECDIHTNGENFSVQEFAHHIISLTADYFMCEMQERANTTRPNLLLNEIVNVAYEIKSIK